MGARMFDGRSRRTTVLLLVPAAVAGIGLAGCSSSSSHSSDAALSAKAAAKAAAGAFSAAKLRGALLTRVNGVGAAAPAASGDFSSLSAAAGARQASAAKATPKDCAQATQTGFDSAVLAHSPAAAVTFKLDANGVSEMLVSSPAGV